MVYKRVSKIIFAAILAVTVFSGCGNRQEEGIDKTETETTTQKSTQDSTQDVTQEEETKYPSITSDGKIKDYKSVVTVDDTAYELYTYLDKTADNYAKIVNKVADTLTGKSDVYDLVIPLSSGITFPDNLKDKISSSDQHDAMQKIQAKMDKHTLSAICPIRPDFDPPYIREFPLSPIHVPNSRTESPSAGIFPSKAPR